MELARQIVERGLAARAEAKIKVRQPLQQLLTNFNQPVDEWELKVLILEGLIPTSKKMVEYIKNRN